MIKFKEKKFSIELVDDMVKGALYGGAFAGGANAIASKLDKKVPFSLFEKQRKKVRADMFDVERQKEEMLREQGFNGDKFQKLNNKIDRLRLADHTYVSLSGMIIGAGLGALYSLGKWGFRKGERKAIVNQCLNQVITYLKKMGFKEEQHFTKDRKFADSLKTKVTIAIVKSSGDLVVLVNSKNDPKLNSVNKEIVKRLPTETVSQKETDRFNEITITSTSCNNGDAVFISTIAEKFIRAGFPVYLLEVSN